MYRDKAARRGLGPLTTAPGPDYLATDLYEPAVPEQPTDPLPQTLGVKRNRRLRGFFRFGRM